MKRVLRVLVAVTTVGAVIAAPATAVAGRDPSGLQKQLDGVVAGSAVGALAEVRTGHSRWRGTSGVAERETTRPVPVDGRFRAGSITKTFVATVVLQLVGAGELRLDDPVEKWLPGVVPNGENITVRHLLNHTSGLADYKKTLPMPPSPEFFANRWRTWTADEFIQRAVAQPPVHETPGKVFDYSNTNYILLGEIIEKITGETYADEIERRLIKPLHLRGTEMPGTSPRIRGPHPRGYVPADRTGENFVDFTELNPSLFGAGGELISTTADLNRFMSALLTGRLLRPHLLAEMKKPGVPGGDYGLGLTWRDLSCGLRVYGNDGDALAYHSWSFVTPDARRQASVALTPNFDGDSDDYIDGFLDEAFCP
ncbi:serine hydrolase domain-containing protein [Kribbella sp. CA-247076]|uniref:serine hydrolase domain-containing protein n=1 Tax=Kribbella sp. CA-247076 TaxID=3239941 RepID=UPI003D89C316